MTTQAAEPDLAHYQQVLADMIDLGAAVAKKLADRIDDATPAEAVKLATAFERVTRAVRRTILLSIHLHKTAAAAQRTAGRARILRDVGDAISQVRREPAEVDALHVELVERLDAFDLAPDLDREIATRPLSDIVLDLKRDMGLCRVPGMPPWPRRTPDDVADLLAIAKHPTDPAPPVRQRN